jgi:hypothetical protein
MLLLCKFGVGLGIVYRTLAIFNHKKTGYNKQMLQNGAVTLNLRLGSVLTNFRELF